MSNHDIIREMLDVGRSHEAQAWLDQLRIYLPPDEVDTLQMAIWATGDLPRKQGHKFGSGDKFSDLVQEVRIAAAVASRVAAKGDKRGATNPAICSVALALKAKGLQRKGVKEVERLYYKWREHLNPEMLRFSDLAERAEKFD